MQQLPVQHLPPVDLLPDHSGDFPAQNGVIAAVVDLDDYLHALHRAVHPPVALQRVSLRKRTATEKAEQDRGSKSLEQHAMQIPSDDVATPEKRKNRT